MTRLQEELVNEFSAAAELVGGLSSEAVRQHRTFLATAVGLVRNMRGYLEAHGEDGRMRVTLDLGKTVQTLRKALGGR